VTLFEREGSEVEALLTDRYLERVLDRATGGASIGPVDSLLNPVLRDAADKLRRDLVRVHPSFRFEERLASRLAEAAAALRMPAAVGAEGGVVPIGVLGGGRPERDGRDDGVFPFDEDDLDRRELSRPLLIGGALTSAAISLAGAAWVAWRARPARRGSAMVRAARAVREARLAAVHAGRLD
jgi:hypothetical protein